MTHTVEEVQSMSQIMIDILDEGKEDLTKVLAVNAANAVASILKDVPDKGSAGITLFEVGKLLSEVSLDIADTDKLTGSTIASYGVALIIASHELTK